MISVVQQTTNMIYAIDDGTGQVEARHWIDPKKENVQDIWRDIRSVMHPKF